MLSSPEEDQMKHKGDGSSRPQQDCVYCSGAEASKKLGMSGEHTIFGANKNGLSESKTCCHG